MYRVSNPLSPLCLVVLGLTIALTSIFFAPTARAATSTLAVAPIGAGTAPGQTVSDPNCVQPPANVDHAAFTDAQLALYGLPAHASGESLMDWQKAVRSAKHRVCTGIVTNVSHLAPRKQPEISAGDEGSNNWGGYIAYNYGYSEAIGQWNVPCLTLLLHVGGSGAWAGIGGDSVHGGGNLVQSGTAQMEYSNFPGHWIANYYAWIQDYPWNQSAIKKFSVNCGDSVYADDWQSYINGNPNAAYMYIEDLTSGQYAESINTNSFSNGSTAEWIIERSSSNGDLSDFNYIKFTNCYASRNNSDIAPLNLPHDYGQIDYDGYNFVTIGALYADSSDGGDHFQINFLHSY